MKKIVILLAVIIVDLISLQMVSARSFSNKSFLIYQPFILLFLTLMVTFFLFYEQHFVAGHEYIKKILDQGRVDSGELKQEAPLSVLEKKRVTVFKKEKAVPLELQYQFIELVKNEITSMKESGKSDGEIINSLKSEKWDPQIIYIALSRARKEKHSGK